MPILVVEVLSPSTRALAQGAKREFYRRAGVAEYWVVDRRRRTVTSVRPGHPDVVSDASLTWQPSGATEPLVMEVRALFDGDHG